MPKIAILALYLRLFKSEAWFRVSSWCVISIIVAFMCAQLALAAKACAPVHGIWAYSQSCGSWMNYLLLAGGPLWVLVDILIFCLPFPIILGLNLERRKKIGLSIVFMAGFFGIVCSIVSLYYRIKIFKSVDKLWDCAVVDACIFAEGYTTIIVSCTPALYTLWSKHFVNSTLYSSIKSTFSRSTQSQIPSTSTSTIHAEPKECSTSYYIKGTDDYHKDLLPANRVLRREDRPFDGAPGHKDGITKVISIDQYSLEKQ
ncbi:MAG: hypothetical protein Q9160_005421 [Pyrenula sp. 1 TL-2023]